MLYTLFVRISVFRPKLNILIFWLKIFFGIFIDLAEYDICVFECTCCLDDVKIKQFWSQPEGLKSEMNHMSCRNVHIASAVYLVEEIILFFILVNNI